MSKTPKTLLSLGLLLGGALLLVADSTEPLPDCQSVAPYEGHFSYTLICDSLDDEISGEFTLTLDPTESIDGTTHHFSFDSTSDQAVTAFESSLSWVALDTDIYHRDVSCPDNEEAYLRGFPLVMTVSAPEPSTPDPDMPEPGGPIDYEESQEPGEPQEHDEATDADYPFTITCRSVIVDAPTDIDCNQGPGTTAACTLSVAPL